jgi:hypothetical protein
MKTYWLNVSALALAFGAACTDLLDDSPYQRASEKAAAIPKAGMAIEDVVHRTMGVLAHDGKTELRPSFTLRCFDSCDGHGGQRVTFGCVPAGVQYDCGDVVCAASEGPETTKERQGRLVSGELVAMVLKQAVAQCRLFEVTYGPWHLPIDLDVDGSVKTVHELRFVD